MNCPVGLSVESSHLSREAEPKAASTLLKKVILREGCIGMTDMSEATMHCFVRNQQIFIDALAMKYGFVAYRPDYHAKKGDANTVMFYTKEDEAHNRKVDRKRTRYSRSEASDLMKALKHEIPAEYIYRDSFFDFANTDINGCYDPNFGNFGRVDLRHSDWMKRLEGAIVYAYIRRKQLEYIRSCGGYGGIYEADQTYNDFNRALIQAYWMKHGKAYLGNINFHGKQREAVLAGAPIILTEYKSGVTVCNFEFSFCIPCRDEKLETLIRAWNGAKLPLPASTLDDIMTRIEQLGGFNLVWY